MDCFFIFNSFNMDLYGSIDWLDDNLRESMERIMSYQPDNVQGEISIYSIRQTDNMDFPNIDKILSI